MILNPLLPIRPTLFYLPFQELKLFFSPDVQTLASFMALLTNLDMWSPKIILEKYYGLVMINAVVSVLLACLDFR